MIALALDVNESYTLLYYYKTWLCVRVGAVLTRASLPDHMHPNTMESTGFSTITSDGRSGWSLAADYHQQSSTAAGSGNSTTNNSVPPQSSLSSVLLSYPHDFFNTKTGLGPKDAAAAVALWPYRKHRPPNGTVDPEPADGMKMLQEVKGMRDRLKSHIEQVFMKDARVMAGVWNLKDPRTNLTPHTSKDFVRALVALK